MTHKDGDGSSGGSDDNDSVMMGIVDYRLQSTY